MESCKNIENYYYPYMEHYNENVSTMIKSKEKLEDSGNLSEETINNILGFYWFEAFCFVYTFLCIQVFICIIFFCLLNPSHILQLFLAFSLNVISFIISILQYLALKLVSTFYSLILGLDKSSFGETFRAILSSFLLIRIKE